MDGKFFLIPHDRVDDVLGFKKQKCEIFATFGSVDKFHLDNFAELREVFSEVL
jgi:glutamate/tyrosine decarboxylase-like PLP-dependent enzyme